MRNFIVKSLLLFFLACISCNSQPGQKSAPAISKNGDVEVYYFHMTTRCVTCKTIEAEARKNIDILYPELVKSGRITFTALNIEEPAGKSMGEKLGVNSQALLIVKGDQKINITNEGFLYAVSKPQKFTEVMKAKIDPLINQ
jgi:hypothetical protein